MLSYTDYDNLKRLGEELKDLTVLLTPPRVELFLQWLETHRESTRKLEEAENRVSSLEEKISALERDNYELQQQLKDNYGV